MNTTGSIKGRPFDSWAPAGGGGAIWFSVKKKIVQQIVENMFGQLLVGKYSLFMK